jgi:hypothetical protein
LKKSRNVNTYTSPAKAAVIKVFLKPMFSTVLSLSSILFEEQSATNLPWVSTRSQWQTGDAVCRANTSRNQDERGREELQTLFELHDATVAECKLQDRPVVEAGPRMAAIMLAGLL